jgi:hypothetical protein
MNSILSAISEEINHPVISELLSGVEFDFESGAVKVGLSNLKIIREYFIEENVEEHLVEALDALIKAISCKKFDNVKTARKTIEKIMHIIYTVEDEEESDDEDEYNKNFVLEQSKTLRELNRLDDESDDEESDDDDESDDEESDDDDESDDEENDDDEEMVDLDDAVERYNDLLKNKDLNKYIVAKRFKITSDVKEDEEKREMIKGLYKVVKNIYENFASEKDAEKILDVLEEIDEINGMI